MMKVTRCTNQGYYLSLADIGESQGILLLKSRAMGQELNVGDEVSVFIYMDSDDKITGTLNPPKCTVGSIAYLEVVSVTRIGAFIDIGIDKDILVPIKEQKYKLEAQNQYLFYMYVDKTGRIAATTYIEKYLENSQCYRVGDEVTGVCYGFQTNGSAMIAVDNKYRGVILKNEYFNTIKPGDKLILRIKKFYEDDKMALTPRKAAIDERLGLQDVILDYLKDHEGFMPYNDKTSPEVINNIFHQSKKYFKNALGGLMKQRLITQDDEGTYLK